MSQGFVNKFQSLLVEPERPHICQGRLTGETGVPISTSNRTDLTTLYFTPHKGNEISIFNTTTSLWETLQFEEVSLDISAYQRNTCYDIFAYKSGTTIALDSVIWNSPDNGTITSISNASPRVVSTATPPPSGTKLVTIAGNSVASNNATWRVGTIVAGTSFQLLELDGDNSTSPGSVGSDGTFIRKDDTDSRVSELELQDGVKVKNGDAGYRYLGAIKMTDVTGELEDSTAHRGIWNYYNQVDRVLLANVEADINYGSASWQVANNNYTYIHFFVIGLLDDYVSLRANTTINPSADGVLGAMTAQINKTDTSLGDHSVSNANTQYVRAGLSYDKYPQVGSNYLCPIVFASASSVDFYSTYAQAVIKA